MQESNINPICSCCGRHLRKFKVLKNGYGCDCNYSYNSIFVVQPEKKFCPNCFYPMIYGNNSTLCSNTDCPNTEVIKSGRTIEIRHNGSLISHFDFDNDQYEFDTSNTNRYTLNFTKEIIKQRLGIDIKINYPNDTTHKTGKGYSIITDFGCKTNCSYCIWKSHPMYGKKFDRKLWLEKVKEFIQICPDNKLSISGGGDPLNEINNNMDFWRAVKEVCLDTKKRVDIHTSYIGWNNIRKHHLADIINRMVLHSNCKKVEKQIGYIRKYKVGKENTRINLVITNKVNLNILKTIEEKLWNTGIQLSYREYVGEAEKPSSEVSEFCSTIHDRLWNGRYVKQDDYNIYLFPNGKVYENFLTAGSEEND